MPTMVHPLNLTRYMQCIASMRDLHGALVLHTLPFPTYIPTSHMGSYKTRNGTERNETGSNCCTIRTCTPDMLWKIGVNMPGSSMYGELISRPVPAPRRRDKHSAASLEPHQAYETF